MHLHASIAELARKGNDLGDDELSDGARVAERRIEDRDAMLSGILQVDLVGANAEATDSNKVLGMGENFGGQLCLGSNTKYVNVAEVVFSTELRRHIGVD